ncbi:GNAT family N-acetyltransferase [Octadecabacter sp. R77987]|uniref:GNAT family N-acetyltransferase n=1 Tax=Octadecabacter sp. R77987 TaxID=3093874 RepID=UPI00366C1787
MTLQRREIVWDHLRPLFDLKVAVGQEGQVAPNEITLAQQPYDPASYVWGLWDGETLVGLLGMIHPLESDEMEDGDDYGAAYIWRLMIGADHQGKGYGRKAIALAGEVATEWGLPRICLTFVDKAGGAEGFYLKCGFQRTGRIDDGELEMVRDV